MKCYLVINPRSRGGKACRHFKTIFRLMEKEGLEYDYVFSSSYEGMKEASAYANGKDYDAIIAVGGDGTINAVINGFYEDDGKLRSDKLLGILYTGTSPDFCKSYRVPVSLSEAINAISRGYAETLRTGAVTFQDMKSAGHMQRRHFACCASVGIGAMVASRANQYRKYLGDFLGTLLSIILSLIRFKTGPVSVITSAGTQEIPKVTNIFIGRTKYIASGIKSCKEMGQDDPRFYVITVKNLKIRNLFQLLRQVYSGNILESEVTGISYSEHIQVIPKDKTYDVEFDGDPIGYTPCTFKPSTFPLKLIRHEAH